MEAIQDPPVHEILRVEAGSRMHGISTGSDDTDIMSVGIEPRDVITGLGSFESWVYRTAQKGKKSQPGDIDWVMYGLKKFLYLAIKGNPTIINVFFAPPDMIYHFDKHGADVLGLRDAVMSKASIPRYIGYLRSQRERALRGSGIGHGDQSDRREKWASHMVRLGFQGLELASSGRLTLPMGPDQGKICRDIKQGILSVEQALDLSEELELELKSIPDDEIQLPDEPDIQHIESVMNRIYLRFLLSEDY